MNFASAVSTGGSPKGIDNFSRHHEGVEFAQRQHGSCKRKVFLFRRVSDDHGGESQKQCFKMRTRIFLKEVIFVGRSVDHTNVYRRSCKMPVGSTKSIKSPRITWSIFTASRTGCKSAMTSLMKVTIKVLLISAAEFFFPFLGARGPATVNN